MGAALRRQTLEIDEQLLKIVDVDGQVCGSALTDIADISPT